MKADPRLDALVEFDERSRLYPIATLTRAVVLRTRSHRIQTRLDQGQEGACVGFGWAHELASTPAPWAGLTNDFARQLYKDAQQVDEWPGDSYSGTSVLAGAKVMAARGYMREYRWTFGIDDLLDALMLGPVVVGTNWHDSMYDPPSTRLLDTSGRVVGRHCYLIRGLTLKPRLKGLVKVGPCVRVWNSWSWNDAYITVEDFERLLLDGGEGCVPVGRRRA